MDDAAFAAMQAEMAAMRDAVQQAKTSRRENSGKGALAAERLKTKTQRTVGSQRIDFSMRALTVG